MLALLFPALLLLAQPAPTSPEVVAVPEAPTPVSATATAAAVPPPPAEAAPAAPANLQPLSFYSRRFKFKWDQYLPIDAQVDGLKINSIFFNKRTLPLFKSAEFGTRAEVSVTNTASSTRTPGFAVAVFDAEDRLVGVAYGGPKIGGIPAGEDDHFDLAFHQVVERIPRADHFYLTVELSQ